MDDDPVVDNGESLMPFSFAGVRVRPIPRVIHFGPLAPIWALHRWQP
jgi:hypothetical protein